MCVCVCAYDTFCALGVPNITVVVTGATDDNGDGRYNVMQGNNFIITCMLSCPTTAAVIWRQGDDVISSSDTMMILDDFSITYIPNDNGEIVESVLMKDMAGPSDSGTYQCSVAVQTIQSNDTADIFVYSKCSCIVIHYAIQISLLALLTLVYTQYSCGMQ